MNSKTYASSDFYLSAYLKAKGLTLLSTEKEGRRSTFIFEDTDTRRELVLAFYNNGEVSVNAFKNAIQDLKAIVYNL